MELPRERPAPPEYGSAPVMTLTRVVFPEPLGPISPRISPSRRSKLTSETAASPPNFFVTPRASSMVMSLDPVRAEVSRELARRELALADHVDEAPGHEQHDENDDETVEELGQAHQLCRKDLGDRGEHEGAQERTDHGTHAAEHRHDDHLDGHDDLEHALGI